MSLDLEITSENPQVLLFGNKNGNFSSKRIYSLQTDFISLYCDIKGRA